jgi:hypothetical protein
MKTFFKPGDKATDDYKKGQLDTYVVLINSMVLKGRYTITLQEIIKTLNILRKEFKM